MKFYGMVGYRVTEETSPGVHTETIVEKPHYGDITRNTKKWENGESLNDDLNIANDISILADPFAYAHFHDIRYVVLYGGRWKVRSVEIQRPRLLLSLGGVYNGPVPKNKPCCRGVSN